MTDVARRARGGDTESVGFNPYRKFKASPLDYVLVVAALLTTAGLVVWAALG